MGFINALKDWAHVDERTKLQAEDHIKNVLFNKLAANQQSITDGTNTTQTATLNVSILAMELQVLRCRAPAKRPGKDQEVPRDLQERRSATRQTTSSSWAAISSPSIPTWSVTGP